MQLTRKNVMMALLAMSVEDALQRHDILMAASNLETHINTTDPVERVTMLTEMKEGLEQLSKDFNNVAVDLQKVIDAEKNPQIIIAGKEQP